jgi:hypothetical protein
MTPAPLFQLRLAVELRVTGPFTTKSAALGGYGVDAVLLRTQDGRPLLPGSQVRGRLRDALEKLAAADPNLLPDIGQWFGPEVARDDDQPSNGQRRRAWYFSDFEAPERFRSTEPYHRLLTRIALDQDTGSARQGALLVAETAARPGEEIPFNGVIDVAADSRDDLLRAVDRLYRGLCWIPSFGSFRSVGFGCLAGIKIQPSELTCWSVEPTSVAEAQTAVAEKVRTLTGASQTPVPPLRAAPGPSSVSADYAERYQLNVTVSAPFCVAERRTNRNVTESVEYLSGAVLKGAVAAQLRFVLGLGNRADLTKAGQGTSWEPLCRHFGSLRFCAAFPSACAPTPRPTVAPASLVKGAADKRCRDVALCEKPFVFRAVDDGVAAPTFAVDWKESNTPGWDSGWATPARDLRLHSSIDPAQRRVRKEHLFAQELIRPDGFVWRGAVDLDRAPAAARPDVLAALQRFLAHATPRIGKTKAPAHFTLGEAVPAPSFAPLERDLWIVTLQAPALLTDPRELNRLWREENEPLRIAYEEVWNELSGGKLKLLRFFAGQTLHGGFLAGKRPRGMGYNPYFITRAGSVFVLQATGNVDEARGFVEGWYRAGLPLPGWAVALYGTDYSTNPYLPADGFGEVAINLPCHESLRPANQEVTYL